MSEPLGTITVTFERSGVSAPWDPASPSLLDFAEAHGISPPFSCRAGVCGSCLSGLRSGAVDYLEPPLTEPGPGELLLCCSTPRESVVIDL
jgi:ferredoxin